MTLENNNNNNNTLNEKIVRQVEFYLSDTNMARDKFLRELSGKDTDGWMPISTIASFSRMKLLSEDVGVIAGALKEAGSNVFQVDESGEMIKRKHPLPESQDLMPRSVYVKGFPKESQLDDLLTFFKPYAGVEAVRMRRFPKSKDFKGSVFVEFASESDAKAFLDLDALMFNNQALIKMSKMAYLESKNRENVKPDLNTEFEKLATEYTRGCLVKLTGVPANQPHQSLKKEINDIFPVEIAFVEQQTNGTAYVRLKEPKGEELVEALKEKKVKINDSLISASKPSDEEEAKYYRNLAAVMISKRSTGKYTSGSKKNRNQREVVVKNEKKREADSNDEVDSESSKQVKIEDVPEGEEDAE